MAVRADDPDVVVGYTYAGGFRSERSAYRFTSELSLFCDHTYMGRGIGSRMLREILAVLKAPETFFTKYGGSYPEGVEPRKIRHLIAVMAVNDVGKRGGMALKEFYESFGFVFVSAARQSSRFQQSDILTLYRGVTWSAWASSLTNGKLSFVLALVMTGSLANCDTGSIRWSYSTLCTESRSGIGDRMYRQTLIELKAFEFAVSHHLP